jgi:hypothetical protein
LRRRGTGEVVEGAATTSGAFARAAPTRGRRNQIMWSLAGYFLARVIIALCFFVRLTKKIYSWYFHVEVGLFIYLILNFYRMGVFTFSSAAKILSGQKAGW